MGGIIMGALAGAGGQMVDLADKSITQDHALERERVSSDLATQRAEALELFKESRGNVMRDQRNARIDSAAGAIADDRLAPKMAQEQAGITDPSSWTPEQQAAVDQSNQMDRKGIIAQAKTDGSAAIASGDIEPKDALASNSKLEVAGVRQQAMIAVQEAKNEAWREKIDFLTKKTSEDNNTRMLIAAMRSMNGGGKDGAGGDTTKIRTANVYLESVNKERKAAGQEPMSFEEAYSISNYAPKASQEDSIRARVATKLIESDPKLAKNPQALRDAVTNTMNAISADDTTPLPGPTPKPGASAPARPPLSSFQK